MRVAAPAWAAPLRPHLLSAYSSPIRIGRHAMLKSWPLSTPAQFPLGPPADHNSCRVGNL